jgi:hypothetical protein
MKNAYQEEKIRILDKVLFEERLPAKAPSIRRNTSPIQKIVPKKV